MIASYKCLNCGGSMVFEPETQKFVCEYCTSSFSKEEVQNTQKDSTQEENTTSSSSAQQTESSDGSAGESQTVFFTCPSCGAEIAATGTDMIAKCFYCHSSVVRSQNTGKAFAPDGIVPFSITKEKAKETFLSWAKKKKFVPSDFFSKKQIENLSGVYYPYWLANCTAKASAEYKAKNVRSWESGNTRFIETSNYKVEREGELVFKDITKRALSKEDSRIGESVEPFNFSEIAQYTPAYLLGFQSQCRDIEKETVYKEIEEDVNEYSQDMLKNTVEGYDGIKTKSANVSIAETLWKYVLVPVWVLTYKGYDGKIYSYGINGQTGKTFGELPVSFKKLSVLFATVFVSATAIISALEYFLC